MQIPLGKVLILLTIFALFFVMKLFFWDSNDSQKFCKRYIPILQNYYKEHQTYPFALKDVTLYEDSHENIDQRCGYDMNKTSFSFSFSDGWFGIKGYESTSDIWWQD